MLLLLRLNLLSQALSDAGVIPLTNGWIRKEYPLTGYFQALGLKSSIQSFPGIQIVWPLNNASQVWPMVGQRITYPAVPLTRTLTPFAYPLGGVAAPYPI